MPAADTPLPRLLVLDDEAEMRGMLRRFLGARGFEVRAVGDGAEMQACLQRQPYDLLILDVMLKDGEDGLSICQRLRAQGQTLPILMLTARGDPADRVGGLQLGADDYLAKPFVPDELVARIQAMLRRQQMLLKSQSFNGATLVQGEAPQVRFGPFQLHLGQQALSREGAPVPLGSAEMRLLCALAASPNRPLSRDTLMERAHGRDYAAHVRSVDVQVMRLRQVLETQPSAPRYLKTVWGLGYLLAVDEA